MNIITCIFNSSKYIFFFCHLIGIFTTIFGWIINTKILLLHPFVILSWKLNNNKCILTQLEYYLFKSTLIGNGTKFVVPSRPRYLLYTSFCIGVLYNYINYFFQTIIYR